MKYSHFSLGTIEAVLNKLGGENIPRFLSGELKLTQPNPSAEREVERLVKKYNFSEHDKNLLRECLGQLQVVTNRRIRPIIIDLSRAPKPPFDGAVIDTDNPSLRKAKIEKRQDGKLYIDGQKVVLYLSEKQKLDEYIVGHKLREELTGKPVLTAAILDALVEHPELFPESWKKDEEGNTRYVFFWGTIFRHSDGFLYVRCCFFGDGQWDVYNHCLDEVWRFVSPAALLAS